MIRFRDTFDWGEPQTWVYVGGVTVALIGAVAIYVGLEARWRRRASAPVLGADAAG